MKIKASLSYTPNSTTVVSLIETTIRLID